MIVNDQEEQFQEQVRQIAEEELKALKKRQFMKNILARVQLYKTNPYLCPDDRQYDLHGESDEQLDSYTKLII